MVWAVLNRTLSTYCLLSTGIQGILRRSMTTTATCPGKPPWRAWPYSRPRARRSVPLPRPWRLTLPSWSAYGRHPAAAAERPPPLQSSLKLPSGHLPCHHHCLHHCLQTDSQSDAFDEAAPQAHSAAVWSWHAWTGEGRGTSAHPPASPAHTCTH